uniref:Uncharacterized protein n=1 Tax=viral metagenome TaxID=1070528 RepID=A0A6C0C8Y7_9ZZZZ
MSESNFGLWILVICAIVIGFVIYIVRQGDTIVALEKKVNDEKAKAKDSLDMASDIKKNQKYLWDVKIADENIFNYIRCINIPRTPACKDTTSGQICRTRQIDCNKFKLVLENDPVSLERLKLATVR